MSDERAEQSDLEQDIDLAIAACGGDMRATIRALILANAYLERELAKSVSAGYVKRRKVQ